MNEEWMRKRTSLVLLIGVISAIVVAFTCVWWVLNAHNFL